MIEGHGDDAYRYGGDMALNFSSNVYSRITLTPLWQHLSKRMEDGLLGAYPEPEPYTLEAALARHFGMQDAQVMATSGATEAIYLIAQTFRGARNLILQPTFSEYADACLLHAHHLSMLSGLPGEADQWQLPKDTDMLWLCNPNNPTGNVVEAELLRAMFRANPRVTFVVDQSYEAFSARPLLSAAEAAHFSNVLVLHSLTKRYALPGIRLGYVTGAVPLLHRLRSHRMPWSVNALAIEAGLFLLGHPEVGQFDLAACLRDAECLRRELERTEFIEVFPTETHYMLCRLKKGTAADLKDYLARHHGILIRDASNFHGLDARYFRVASQGREQDERLVECINSWLKEQTERT